MASALDEAHSAGIVHRDIKSANAVVSANGQVKVLDFGLVRQTRDAAGVDSQLSTDARTQVGVVMGTVPYSCSHHPRLRPGTASVGWSDRLRGMISATKH